MLTGILSCLVFVFARVRSSHIIHTHNSTPPPRRALKAGATRRCLTAAGLWRDREGLHAREVRARE